MIIVIGIFFFKGVKLS